MSCNKEVLSEGFTLERLKLLESAIADGVLTVKYTDKMVTYQSMDDLLKARQVVRSALGLNGDASGKNGLFGGKRIIGRHSKGLTDED